jgi:hypothetical protein
MRLAIALVPLAIVVSGCGGRHRSASSLAPVHGRYSPSVDAKNFVAKVDNPLWP